MLGTRTNQEKTFFNVLFHMPQTSHYLYTYYKSCCYTFAAKKNQEAEFFFSLCTLSFDFGYLSVQLFNQTLDNSFDATATLAGNHKAHHQVIAIRSIFFSFFFFSNKTVQLFPLNTVYFKSQLSHISSIEKKMFRHH